LIVDVGWNDVGCNWLGKKGKDYKGAQGNSGSKNNIYYLYCGDVFMSIHAIYIQYCYCFKYVFQKFIYWHPNSPMGQFWEAETSGRCVSWMDSCLQGSYLSWELGPLLFLCICTLALQLSTMSHTGWSAGQWFSPNLECLASKTISQNKISLFSL
jgi:hypothetical protein